MKDILRVSHGFRYQIGDVFDFVFVIGLPAPASQSNTVLVNRRVGLPPLLERFPNDFVCLFGVGNLFAFAAKVVAGGTKGGVIGAADGGAERGFFAPLGQFIGKAEILLPIEWRQISSTSRIS